MSMALDNATDRDGDIELVLDIGGPSADQYLRELNGWLAAEDELRGRQRLRRRTIATGDMGGLLEVLTVTLGSGGAGAVLATSLSTWLTQRRADVVVTVTSSDGRQVTVDVHRAADPVELIREVGNLVNPASSAP
jgi:hypothetical protein